MPAENFVDGLLPNSKLSITAHVHLPIDSCLVYGHYWNLD